MGKRNLFDVQNLRFCYLFCEKENRNKKPGKMLEEANKNNKNPSFIRIIINSHYKAWGKGGKLLLKILALLY
jgi:hypothetical protein